jgi:hypothetical protein
MGYKEQKLEVFNKFYNNELTAEEAANEFLQVMLHNNKIKIENIEKEIKDKDFPIDIKLELEEKIKVAVKSVFNK